jgi:peptidoglycan lytic transglycosylase
MRHRTALERPGIDKTMSSRIVLVLRRPIFVGRGRIAVRCVTCALALMIVATGCARHTNARLPARIGSTETGIASWYGVPYNGRPTASGEIFDMEKLTAAHRALPFETWVEITNLSNGKQVDVRITDRGPFVRGRIIDLSAGAARQIDMVRAGTAKVRLRVINAPLPSPPPTSPPLASVPVSAVPVSAAPVNVAPLNTLPVGPTSPPVKPLASPHTGAGGYAVQAGAFADPARAEALRETLSYSDARVVEPHGDRSLWRVLVGHALTIQAASALAAEVEKTAGAAFVVWVGATE